MLTITIQPNTKADLPTTKAAEKIEDILCEDNTCLEEEDAGDADVDGDNTSVATDTSSDSESELDEEDTALDSTNTLQATQNVAALGEQAISCTVFELKDMASKLSDPAPQPTLETVEDVLCPILGPTALNLKKRKTLLPPSPEKSQKRHQLFGIH
ncbi:hypothetical protein K438DRAFT_1770194 [Mycena galopus ATCC 62051]|nr:hypothetical protein K438DRAFT_1770194 [Mycena galopus ATCC 62051]